MFGRSRAQRAYDQGKADSIRSLWGTYRIEVDVAHAFVDDGDAQAASQRLAFAGLVRQEIENLIGSAPTPD